MYQQCTNREKEPASPNPRGLEGPWKTPIEARSRKWPKCPNSFGVYLSECRAGMSEEPYKCPNFGPAFVNSGCPNLDLALQKIRVQRILLIK